jgi:hypothetical membrane protein
VGRLGARTAAVMWLGGATVYLLSEAIAAASLPGYSYLADYISDLGVVSIMNVGFALHGALFFAGAIVISRCCPGLGGLGRAFVIAAAANAMGNVLVGTFTSGSPDHRQWHVIGAGLAIVGGNIAVIVAGFAGGRFGAHSYGLASVVIGVIGIACLLALVIDGATGSRLLPVGVVERGAVYSIVGWEIVAGIVILRHSSHKKRGMCCPRL